MNFYTSDLHLGHANVINFDDRTFATDNEKYVERFNDRNFGYDDISIRCVELE